MLPVQTTANQDSTAADLAHALHATRPSRGYSPMQGWDMTGASHAAHVPDAPMDRLQSPNNQVRQAFTARIY